MQYNFFFQKYISNEKNFSFAGTHVSNFSKFMFLHLTKFTRAFEIYCLCFVNKLVIDFTDKKDIKCLRINDFGYVLSFNYTNTFEVLYGSDVTKFCFIHGKAQKDTDKTNMVLGIDETLSGNAVNTSFTFAKFKKYFQRIILKTGSEYKDWIRDISGSDTRLKFEIYILGHSLGLTDHEILKEFFNINSNKVRITIFFHDEVSEIRAVEKTIQMIGKDELIRRVHGSDWSIRFVNQYDNENGIMKHLDEMETRLC